MDILQQKLMEHYGHGEVILKEIRVKISRSSATTSYHHQFKYLGTTWNQVFGAGYNAVEVLTKTDGTLWAWGYNQFGQLAQNNTTSYSSPVQIPGTTWSIQIN